MLVNKIYIFLYSSICFSSQKTVLGASVPLFTEGSMTVSHLKKTVLRSVLKKQ